MSKEVSPDDTLTQNFLKRENPEWKHTEKLETFLGRAEEFAAVFYVDGWGRRLNLIFCSSLEIELNERLILAGIITAMFDLATAPSPMH
jgi:hypothetical protein